MRESISRVIPGGEPADGRSPQSICKEVVVSKLPHALSIAAVALVLPAAALADDTLNLDTGGTGIVGDIVLNPDLSISRQGLPQRFQPLAAP
jgi:hypothetical protein